jgi:hypothetical protein
MNEQLGHIWKQAASAQSVYDPGNLPEETDNIPENTHFK